MTISQIRSTSRYAFRRGEWATLVGVEVRTGDPRWRDPEPRPCFLVVFLDGQTDAWMIFDPHAQYEFRTVEPGLKPEPSPHMIWEERLTDGSAV